MRSTEYILACVLCSYEGSEEVSTTSCPKCNGQLEVLYDPKHIQVSLNKHSLKTTPITATKYLRFLPIQDFTKIVSLNEGGTPLQKCESLGEKYGISNLYIKHEGANPTGVFKDRGSMVELTKAKELHASAVCCASTGNMAASVSAYAAMAKMPCYVVVPEGTPLGKLAQTISYGARIIQVRGTYADCVPLCENMAKKHNFYLAGDYAFRLEGAKTCAYEIIEQLEWQTPDVVIVPIGCGTHLAGIWKGFKDLFALGLISKLPKMIGVQPESVPTVVKAWKEGKTRYSLVEKPNSVASAVSIGVPQDDIKALRALRESGGAGETATDEEILNAEQDMATHESLFVEPASAIPCAVLPILLASGVVSSEDVVVCVSTGTGLKDPKTAISHLPDPPVIEPKDSEIDRYFEMKIYEISNKNTNETTDKHQILFEKTPSNSELTVVLKDTFNAHFDEQSLNTISEVVSQFVQKGKTVSVADMQNIIESYLNDLSTKEKRLEFVDFTIQDFMHSKPTASVTVTFNGQTSDVTGSGDGTFDAIINAIEPIIKGSQPKVELTDYSVDIDTPGSSAVVKVKISLEDENGNKVISTATSPDVIVASVRAFEKGYNNLYWKSQTSS